MQAADQTITTQSGRLEGTLERGVCVFRGIPYALPPTGPRRFRAPEPMPPWSGVRSALEPGASAPQAQIRVPVVSRFTSTRGLQPDEDCLFLNVFTPAADGRRRPVMVWIHGGAYVMGSGSSALYQGHRLARRGDVVVVTLNYRLGALGFLNLKSALPGHPANLGLRDQLAALAWVRDHIEAFGGDPENVTIFGESAGGMSVGTLLGVPAARGLYHRAILQSGAADNVSSPEQAARVAEVFASELGLSRWDPGVLESLPVARILSAQARVAMKLALYLGALPWQPSVDGDLLPEAPLAAIAGGNARNVPVLVGTNRDEWKLFLLGDRKGRRLDEAALARRLARALPGKDREGQPLAERARTQYPPRPGERPVDRWMRFQSERIFHAPALRVARAQAPHGAGTFLYRFDWSPALGRGLIGSCHALEIPFVFGTLRHPALRVALSAGRSARSLSNTVQDAWIAFARSGDPNHERLPAWPDAGEAGHPTLFFDDVCHVAPSPYPEAVRFFDEVA
ncbi:MAG: carboxylesterase/lipase family protein [Proteobacteria bacterium]|nr:carboxylesterase/lipase family protein [Pseudomonadota bacterium]